MGGEGDKQDFGVVSKDTWFYTEHGNTYKYMFKNYNSLHCSNVFLFLFTTFFNTALYIVFYRNKAHYPKDYLRETATEKLQKLSCSKHKMEIYPVLI